MELVKEHFGDRAISKKQSMAIRIKIFFKILLISIAITRVWAISLHYLFQDNKEILERIINDSFHHYQVGIVLIAITHLFRKIFKSETAFAVGLGIFLEEWPVFLNDLGLKTNYLYLSLIDFSLVYGFVVLLYILMFTKLQTASMKIGKILIASGLIAPIIFVTTFLIVANLTPGYDHFKQPVSDLGKNGAPYAEIMNAAGFGISGILISVLGLKIKAKFSGETLKFISMLLIIAGISWAGIGLFPNYQGRTSVYHIISTYLAGAGIIVAAILFSREKIVWPWLRKFSMLAGLFLLTRAITGPLFIEAKEYRGLIQEIYIVVFWLWIVCLNIFLIAKRRHYETH